MLGPRAPSGMPLHGPAPAHYPFLQALDAPHLSQVLLSICLIPVCLSVALDSDEERGVSYWLPEVPVGLNCRTCTWHRERRAAGTESRHAQRRLRGGDPGGPAGGLEGLEGLLSQTRDCCPIEGNRLCKGLGWEPRCVLTNPWCRFG